MTFDLESHLRRQIAFSRATFGPGERRKGVCHHILSEVYAEILGMGDPTGVTFRDISTTEAATEWVDVAILALDGLTRALIASGVDWERVPFVACQMIQAKQDRNEQRSWPDWRTADPDKAIEHLRLVP